MKKKYRVLVYFLTLVIFPAVCLPGYAAPGTDGNGGGGLENLAGKVSRGISDYFAGRGETDIRTAVIKFENFSEVSDLTAHKFYQLLVSRLETRPDIKFTNLMINFHSNKGEFNLNRLDKLNYLVYIKLLKNKNKLGTGIAVFSRVLDKTVYIKYFEEPFSAGTRDIFETRNYGFKGLGFFKQVEIDAGKDLLDFKSVVNPGGQVKYFFYYPRKIDIFNVENNSFKKYFSFKLEWGRPYYPVMAYEGRLCLFYTPGNEALVLTLGGNFSPRAKIFRFKDNVWREQDPMDFVPLKLIRLNDNDYLAGARYDEGKNYFKETLVLVPFASGVFQRDNSLEKKVVPFYSLDFSSGGPLQPLETIHLLDTGYNYRFFTGDFEERTAAPEKRGSALAALDARWLAASAFTDANNDTLYFYKIEEGSNQLVYENRVDGQIIFITAGSWKDRRGFWVYVKKTRQTNAEYASYYLQFWSKSVRESGKPGEGYR